jgi:hypothetical protein
MELSNWHKSALGAVVLVASVIASILIGAFVEPIFIGVAIGLCLGAGITYYIESRMATWYIDQIVDRQMKIKDELEQMRDEVEDDQNT